MSWYSTRNTYNMNDGRGAAAIAQQVKAETGTSKTLDQLTVELEQMIKSWKEDTYIDAWRYMCRCGEAVLDPGYLVNPFGRMRRFPKIKDDHLIAGMQRQAANFRIQSSVGDACMLAMVLMRQYRAKHGLHFRLVNQIHDAVMIETPENEIEKSVQMFKDTMGTIKIPIDNSEPLVLGIDISILDRWGQKRK